MSTGSDPSSLLKCLDATKSVLLSVRLFAHEVVQNHGRGAQTIHFRLTCVAHKRRCLNSVVPSSLQDTSLNERTRY